MVNDVANSQMNLATRRGGSAALPASPKSLEAYPFLIGPQRGQETGRHLQLQQISQDWLRPLMSARRSKKPLSEVSVCTKVPA